MQKQPGKVKGQTLKQSVSNPAFLTPCRLTRPPTSKILCEELNIAVTTTSTNKTYTNAQVVQISEKE